jgi:hypothetical protein
MSNLSNSSKSKSSNNSSSLNPLNSESMSNSNSTTGSNKTVLGSSITSKQKIDVGEWVALCEQHLYNYVETAKCLAYAWNTQTSIANVFLTGSAGYGKSDGATLFCKFLFDKGLICCERPFVLSCSIGTNETILLGGINIGEL